MSELLVLAEIAGRRCAFRANDVQSVIDISEITPVPRAPKFVLGLAAMRSQALTVIDCRTAIGEDADAFPTDQRGAVVRVEGHSYALKLDMIDDVATARSPAGEIAGGFGKKWNHVACGMVETDRGAVLLIDVASLIEGPRETGPSGLS